MNFSWMWLCSNENFTILNDNSSYLNECFIHIVLIIPFYLIFLMINTYYLVILPSLSRHFRHKTIRFIRILAATLFLLCLIQIYLKYFLNLFTKWSFIDDSKISSALIFSDLLQLITIFAHLSLVLNKNLFVKVNYYRKLFWYIIFITLGNILDLCGKIIGNKNTLADIVLTSCQTGLLIFYLITIILSLTTQKFGFNRIFRSNYRLGGSSTQIKFDVSNRIKILNEENEEIDVPEEDSSSFFSYITFTWLQNVMEKGFKRELNTLDDISKLPNDLNTQHIAKRFMSKYSKSETNDDHDPIINPERLNDHAQEIQITFSNHHVSKKSLVKALLKCFGRKFALLGIFKLLNDTLNFGGPLLLQQLVQYIETDNRNVKLGLFYSTLLFLSTFSTSLINTHFSYSLNKLCLRIKIALIGILYNKSIKVQSSELNKYSIGQIVNYMSIDSDSIVNAFPSIHAFWSLPFQVIITLYLLYQQIGLSFLVGLGFVLLLIPINKVLSDYIGKIHAKLMSFKDSRVRLITELICGIRIIKFYAWEDYFLHKISSVRAQELKQLKAKKYLDAFCVYFWACTPILMSVFTFMTYVWLGNRLTASKVFTSLALFNMLIAPLNSFPWVINGLVQAWISLRRVQEYLNLINTDWLTYYMLTSDADNLIEIENTTIQSTFNKNSNKTQKKSKNSSEQEVLIETTENEETHMPKLILNDISFSVKKGQLIGILGRVGCGKSSLLNTIISEIDKINGQIKIDIKILSQGFAYVSQDCWLQATTIKENILFGSEYDAHRYNQVIEACELKHDLQLLPKYDETPIGENGITLSGGQKARLTLARACYKQKEIYLLDDPLSAVDTHVAKNLWNNCIRSLLRDKTILVCTHHIKYLLDVDHVLVIDNGIITQQGEPRDIIPKLLTSIDKLNTNNNILMSEDLMEENEVSSEEMCIDKDQILEKKEYLDEIESKKNDEEEKEHGKISLSVYKHYILSIGICLTCVTLFGLLLMQTSRNATDTWIAYWTQTHTYNTTEDNNVSYFFIIYGTLCGLNSLFTLIRAFSFAYSCILAGKYIHECLIKNLIETTIRFYDTTPRGRILNRVSSDMYAIDDSLPFVLNIALASFISLLGILIITCYSLPWFTLSLVPLTILYYSIQNYYRWTSRELKRLNSLLLSPIYTHFNETLNGLVIIRSFREIKRFINTNNTLLVDYIRSSYVSMAASQWLNFRLQMIGVLMISLVGFIGVLQHVYASNVNASLIGLALSYILSVTGILNGLISTFTETEKEMVSVERAYQFHGLDKENCNGSERVSDTWPERFDLEFSQVSLQYNSNAPLALDNVTFHIKQGEKIGIVGRTGSGKSSLFMVLYRAFELTRGAITIDNQDISKIDLKRLRQSISIIPQDPFLFNGTLRENLDPTQEHTDLDIWCVLKKCHLDAKITSLEYKIEEKGKNFSSGEKQLVCLARALLAQKKLLCIDEATACVDYETDNFIQETIRHEFQNVTVLTIAHRLSTIVDYDKCMVMRNGKLIEFGEISQLINNKSSYFFKLVEAEKST